MSWAAHNPEKYSEICREGIKERMSMIVGLPISEEADAFIDDFLWSIEGHRDKEIRKIFNNLLDISFDQIRDAEADYFSSLANV